MKMNITQKFKLKRIFSKNATRWKNLKPTKIVTCEVWNGMKESAEARKERNQMA